MKMQVQYKYRLDLPTAVSSLLSFLLYWKAIYGDIFIALIVFSALILGPLILALFLSVVATLLSR